MVVGLGNPGPEYAATRHNAGFWLAERLARHWQLSKFKRSFAARFADGTVGDRHVIVIKPLTYMNRSGRALRGLSGRQDFEPATDLLVLVDDVALPIGTFRIRARGSDGGHNGLRSIQGALQSTEYARLRIGVGPEAEFEGSLSDFVLDEFEPQEFERLESIQDNLLACIDCWLGEGVEEAMNRYNRRGSK